jgi:hypothetical protein
VSRDIIASNKAYLVASDDLFLFGLLSSSMHMSWMRLTAGRLESRYQHPATMVYNTFPWLRPGENQKEAVRKAARQVLDARAL